MRYCLILLVAFFYFSSCTKNIDGTVEVVPIPPTDLVATVVSTTQVNLSWTDKSTNESGFRLERKTAATNFNVIATVRPDITVFNDIGLTSNTIYTYRVSAYNSSGSSPTYSNEVTVSTFGLPSITTTAVTNITAISGTSGGNVNSDGGSPVIARGLVWSVSSNPTIALSTKTIEGTGTGVFNSVISGLAVNTKYYVRAYATNAAGTAYGNEISFITSSINIESGLVAYYPFNGNANDESGNQVKLNGIVNGPTLTTDRFDKANSAYLFNGNNISVPHNSRINASQSFSVSLWFMSTSDVIGDLIMKGLGDGAAYTWYLRNHSTAFNSPTVQFVYTPLPTKTIYVAAPTPPINAWTHVVGVINGSILYIYKNGVLINTVLNVDLSNAGQNISGLTIGRTQYPFVGKIDDIRIYNRALEKDEIDFLFKN